MPFSIVEFTARIHKLGLNPCVNVPNGIVNVLLQEANKKNAPVQVKTKLNGKGAFRTNVVRYKGAYRLYLNMQMRRKTGVDVGDSVCVALEYDPRSRTPPMSEHLREALRENKRAKEKWLLQPKSRRNEILLYLNSLKNRESVKRNTSKILRMLLEP